MYDEFEALDKPTPAVISIGLDLAPHYFNFLQNYVKENPGTLVGKPGRLQVDKDNLGKPQKNLFWEWEVRPGH